jgi:hypothetical protein
MAGVAHSGLATVAMRHNCYKICFPKVEDKVVDNQDLCSEPLHCRASRFFVLDSYKMLKYLQNDSFQHLSIDLSKFLYLITMPKICLLPIIPFHFCMLPKVTKKAGRMMNSVERLWDLLGNTRSDERLSSS